MNNLQNHPDEAVLLGYFDGELPSRKSRQTTQHLEACWQCRTVVDDFQTTAADCVRYRNNVLAEHLPAPPAPWADLSDGFDRIDAELASESLAARLHRWLGAPAVRRWAVSGAAAAVMAAGIFIQLRETPAVQAAALLKRAVSVAETRPAAVKKQIQVRTRSRQFTMTAGAPSPEIRAMFDATGYDANDPLSARSFQAWRDGLASKTDEVVTLAGAYRLRTTTAEGPLAAAVMTLRNTDLRPREGRFEFRNQEWVEFTEVPEASTRHDCRSGGTEVGAPTRGAVPSRPDSATSEATASISNELQVVAALHEIEADLGDPLDIQRTGSRVIVSGIGISAARQRDILRALEPVKNVVIQFSAPPAAPDNPAPSAPVAGGRPGAIQSRIEKQLAGRADFLRFSSQLLDWNEAAMARVYALRSLAQRFPAESAASMSPADRELLTDLARAHLAALSG